MALIYKKRLRSKTVINDQILEQVIHFKCFGYSIIYKYDNDIKEKLQAYQVMCDTNNRTLKNKTRDDAILKCIKSWLLLCSCKYAKAGSQNNEQISAESEGLDKFLNEDTRRDLQICSLNNRILERKHQWFQRAQ
jgi:recombinational DNA repair ATPase RecF